MLVRAQAIQDDDKAVPRRLGRPRLAEGERRTDRLPDLRVTPAERHHVERLAERAGLTVSEFTRRSVLGQPMPRARGRTDDRALYELNRIGNNLNQIARAANLGHRLDGMLAAALIELRAAVEGLAGDGS